MNTPEPVPARPDPLIDEVRRIRAEIASDFKNDVRKLAEHLRRVQQEHGTPVLRAPQAKVAS